MAAVRAPAHQRSGTLFAEFCPSFIGMLAVGALHGGTARSRPIKRDRSGTLPYQQADVRYRNAKWGTRQVCRGSRMALWSAAFRVLLSWREAPRPASTRRGERRQRSWPACRNKNVKAEPTCRSSWSAKLIDGGRSSLTRRYENSSSSTPIARAMFLWAYTMSGSSSAAAASPPTCPRVRPYVR